MGRRHGPADDTGGKNQVEPATVAVPPATIRDLGEIRPAGADPEAPVFGLIGEAFANPSARHRRGPPAWVTDSMDTAAASGCRCGW